MARSVRELLGMMLECWVGAYCAGIFMQRQRVKILLFHWRRAIEEKTVERFLKRLLWWQSENG